MFEGIFCDLKINLFKNKIRVQHSRIENGHEILFSIVEENKTDNIESKRFKVSNL